MRLFSPLLSALLLGVCTTTSQAALITYTAQLYDGVPVEGVNLQTAGNSSTPIGATYYSFFATAGDAVTVDGDRLDEHYDMAFWVFSGLFADTDQFGAAFDSGDPGYIDFGDDDDEVPGPFGDPRSVFEAPVTGFYTVAVTNFLSSTGPPNDFRLTATGVSAAPGVPEPGTFTLLSSLLAAGACSWLTGRRQSNRRQSNGRLAAGG